MNYSGVIEEFPGIQVDQFRAVDTAPCPPVFFVLTHAHSDHLQGLDSPSFTGPLIYCSEATKRIVLQLRSSDSGRLKYAHLKPLLKSLPLNVPNTICLSASQSVQLTFIDSNHCPGAVMALISSDQCTTSPSRRAGGHRSKHVLCTGDVRAETWFVDALRYHPALMPYTFGFGARPLDCIYLDTTYGYRDEPFQDIVSNRVGIESLISLISQYPDTTVFVFANLTLGYELVWLSIAQAFQSKLHIDLDGMHMFQFLLDLPTAEFPWGSLLVPWLTTDPAESRFHICAKSCQCPSRSRRDTVFVNPVVCVAEEMVNAKNAGMPLDVFEPPRHRESAMDASTSDITFEEADLGIPDPSLQLLKVSSDSDGGPTYAFGNRRFVPSKHDNFILPANIWYLFSRHSSYAECRHLVSLFKCKRIQPCFIPTDKTLDFQEFCFSPSPSLHRPTSSPKTLALTPSGPKTPSTPIPSRATATPFGRKPIPALIRVPPPSNTSPSKSSTNDSHSQILRLLAGAYNDPADESAQLNSFSPAKIDPSIVDLASKLSNNPQAWFDLHLDFRDKYRMPQND